MKQHIREWTLHEELGHGGMGVVYRASHDYWNGEFAIKVIKPSLVEDEEVRSRFLAEAAIMGRLRHVNIIEAHPPFKEAGTIYLPMEYLQGKSLQDILKQQPGPWPAEKAVAIIRAAAAAVGYVHQLDPPVLHRDLKPGNLFICEDNTVKVMDFGLAKAIGEKSMTAAGMAVGTPANLAPEILKGQDASASSDVYALGVILYRLLAGRWPIDMPEDGSSPWAMMGAVMQAHDKGIENVRTYAPDTSESLSRLVMKTLESDPTKRFSDGQELHSALKGMDLREEKTPNPAADDTELRLSLNVMEKSSEANETSGQITPPSPSESVAQPTEKPTPTKINEKEQEHVSSGKDSETAPQKSMTGKIIGIAFLVILLLGGVVYLSNMPDDSSDPPLSEKTSEDPSPSPPEPIPDDPPSPPPPSVPSSPLPEDIWVSIPGGSFDMGSDDGYDNEKPVHRVTVSSFLMMKTEVTVSQYKVCVVSGPCNEKNFGKKSDDESCNWGYSDRDNHPMNCVTWYGAKKFCEWTGGRLPTEEEWEYEASGGEGRKYPWGTTPKPSCDVAIMNDGGNGCGKDRTWPVCSKLDGNSKHGLCDLAGNVWEWVENCYRKNYASSKDCSIRLYRGGSLNSGGRYLRASNRLRDFPPLRIDAGFRCSREVK